MVGGLELMPEVTTAGAKLRSDIEDAEALLNRAVLLESSGAHRESIRMVHEAKLRLSRARADFDAQRNTHG